MSKLYDCYLEKKLEDDEKIYLFKSGNFYLCLGEDAEILSSDLGLKLTKFSNETNKCGFPLSKLDKYKKFFKLLGYKYEFVLNEVDQIVEDISNIDIDNISSDEALEKIKLYNDILLNYYDQKG